MREAPVMPVLPAARVMADLPMLAALAAPDWLTVPAAPDWLTQQGARDLQATDSKAAGLTAATVLPIAAMASGRAALRAAHIRMIMVSAAWPGWCRIIPRPAISAPSEMHGISNGRLSPNALPTIPTISDRISAARIRSKGFRAKSVETRAGSGRRPCGGGLHARACAGDNSAPASRRRRFPNHHRAAGETGAAGARSAECAAGICRLSCGCAVGFGRPRLPQAP